MNSYTEFPSILPYFRFLKGDILVSSVGFAIQTSLFIIIYLCFAATIDC